MSDFHASIQVYDFMSYVYVGCNVFDFDEPIGLDRRVVWLKEVLPSEGVQDPRDWLKDALILLLERL